MGVEVSDNGAAFPSLEERLLRIEATREWADWRRGLRPVLFWRKGVILASSGCSRWCEGCDIGWMIKMVFKAARRDVSRLTSLRDVLFVVGGIAKVADWKMERAAARSPVLW
jgi:hypothetical protein